MISKSNVANVVVDSEVNKNIPTVVVSSTPQTVDEDEQIITEPKKEINIFAKAIKLLIGFFLDFLETIVVALSIFVVIYLFILQPHEVKGSSMEPNFHNNEYILTDKISYRFVKPQRGDVIIFKSPGNPDIDYIKRVIGLPQDRVKIIAGFVYINDQKLEEIYLQEKTYLYPGSSLQEGINIIVPDEKYFVMGDNRSHSSDSREFGPIVKDSIIGRAFMRYWPLSEFGPVPKFNY